MNTFLFTTTTFLLCICFGFCIATTTTTQIATLAYPVCDDYQRTVLEGNVLNQPVIYTLDSVSPFLFRVAPVVNLYSITLKINGSAAYDAGCQGNETGVVIGSMYCSTYDNTTSTSSGAMRIANDTGYFSITLQSLNVTRWSYFWVSVLESATICPPYPYELTYTGSYAIQCFNGKLNLTSGVCDCPANYTGNTCLISGECNPSSPLMPCISDDGKHGLQACVVNNNYTAHWGVCTISQNNDNKDNAKIYIGVAVAVGVVIAVIGISVGVYMGRKKAKYQTF